MIEFTGNTRILFLSVRITPKAAVYQLVRKFTAFRGGLAFRNVAVPDPDTLFLEIAFTIILQSTSRSLKWTYIQTFRLTLSRPMTYIYICRTAPLTSRCFILYIYSTNIHTEYFKHTAHSPFFPLQNAVYFIMLPFFGSCIIHILYTKCAKI